MPEYRRLIEAIDPLYPVSDNPFAYRGSSYPAPPSAEEQAAYRARQRRAALTILGRAPAEKAKPGEAAIQSRKEGVGESLKYLVMGDKPTPGRRKLGEAVETLFGLSPAAVLDARSAQEAALGIVPGSGAAGPVAKELAKEGTKAARKAITATNLREMPTLEAAIEQARKEEHILPSPTRSEYVGAPPGVGTPEALAEMRRAFDEKVARGVEGSDWYPRAEAGHMEVTGGDPQRASFGARSAALFSAQADPKQNLGFQLQAHNAAVAGVPRELARTGQQARTFNEAFEQDPWAFSGRVHLGPKTEVYAGHMDPTVAKPVTGTNDIWHARAFGYPEASMQGGLGTQQHAFLDAETVLAADRARQAAVGGKTDWSAGEVQAAPWIVGKGEGLAKTRKQIKGDVPAGIKEAAKTYPDYFPDFTGYSTYEVTPGLGTRQLPKYAEGSEEMRQQLARDLRSSWAVDPMSKDPRSHRDVLYDALGMYTRPSTATTGVYQMPGGPVEVNPGMVARPLVSFEGPSGARQIDRPSRALLQGTEALRAYADVQNAAAASAPIYGNKAGTSGSIVFPGGQITPQQAAELMRIGGQYGLPNVIDYGEQLALTNFGGAPGANATRVLRSGELQRAVQGVVPGLGAPRQAQLDTLYMPYEGLWQRPEGTGAVTRQLEQYMTSKDAPDLIDRLDASMGVRQALLDRAERNRALAAEGGGARDDVQRALEIGGEKGLRALFEARRAGVALPSIATLMGLGGLYADPQAWDR